MKPIQWQDGYHHEGDGNQSHANAAKDQQGIQKQYQGPGGSAHLPMNTTGIENCKRERDGKERAKQQTRPPHLEEIRHRLVDQKQADQRDQTRERRDSFSPLCRRLYFRYWFGLMHEQQCV